jgi:hypothetical protein
MKFLKTLKGLLTVFAISTLLVACGGGGDGGTDTGGGGGSSTSLFNAYQAIGPGTTLAQVNALVGYAPNEGTSGRADGSTSASWGTSRTQANFSLFDVSFNPGGGVSLKIFVGPNGTFSQSY